MFLEDGGMNIDWTSSGGAYNLRDPKNNSDQDYEGNFNNPTEKVIRESGYMETDISQPQYSIQFNDINTNSYSNNYLSDNNDTPIEKEKYYKFIQENFDFLNQE